MEQPDEAGVRTMVASRPVCVAWAPVVAQPKTMPAPSVSIDWAQNGEGMIEPLALAELKVNTAGSQRRWTLKPRASTVPETLIGTCTVCPTRAGEPMAMVAGRERCATGGLAAASLRRCRIEWPERRTLGECRRLRIRAYEVSGDLSRVCSSLIESLAPCVNLDSDVGRADPQSARYVFNGVNATNKHMWHAGSV